MRPSKWEWYKHGLGPRNPRGRWFLTTKVARAESVISVDEFGYLLDKVAGDVKVEENNVGVALSGGVDSTVLAHLVSCWHKNRISFLRQKLGAKEFPKIFAFTVDHGLRDVSLEEARMAKTLAESLGFQHEILSCTWTNGTVRPPHISRLQAQAREERYKLLADACERHCVVTLLAAHHLNDQFETFLHRLARRSDLRGLGSMHENVELGFSMNRFRSRSHPIFLVRPLLGLPKSRLVATAKQYCLKYVDDPSNDNLMFDRVRIRGAISRMDTTSRESALNHLSALLGQIQEASKTLDQHAERLWKHCVCHLPAEHVSIGIYLDSLQAKNGIAEDHAHVEIQQRVLQRAAHHTVSKSLRSRAGANVFRRLCLWAQGSPEQGSTRAVQGILATVTDEQTIERAVASISGKTVNANQDRELSRARVSEYRQGIRQVLLFTPQGLEKSARESEVASKISSLNHWFPWSDNLEVMLDARDCCKTSLDAAENILERLYLATSPARRFQRGNEYAKVRSLLLASVPCVWVSAKDARLLQSFETRKPEARKLHGETFVVAAEIGNQRTLLGDLGLRMYARRNAKCNVNAIRT